MLREGNSAPHGVYVALYGTQGVEFDPHSLRGLRKPLKNPIVSRTGKAVVCRTKITISGMRQTMVRYKTIDTGPRFLAVDLKRRLVAGTFEHALIAQYSNQEVTAEHPLLCPKKAIASVCFWANNRAHSPWPFRNAPPPNCPRIEALKRDVFDPWDGFLALPCLLPPVLKCPDKTHSDGDVVEDQQALVVIINEFPNRSA